MSIVELLFSDHPKNQENMVLTPKIPENVVSIPKNQAKMALTPKNPENMVVKEGRFLVRGTAKYEG